MTDADETPRAAAARKRYEEGLYLNDVLARSEARVAAELRAVTSPATRGYAWCFSHGRTHYFYPDDTPWCTALWVYLAGATEGEARADKRARYGDARFIHELPDVEAQAAVMQLSQQQQPEEGP